MLDCLDEYEQYLLNIKKASANTVSSYMRDIRQFRDYVAELLDVELPEVSKDQISVYLAYLTNHGKSPATVTRSLASLKGFYGYLMSEGLVQQNPAKGITVVKAEKKLPQILTGKEVELLLEQPQCTDMKGYRDKAMLELLYATGIRVSELISLDVDDVNLPAGFIRCEGSGRSRTIPMYPAAVKALQTYDFGHFAAGKSELDQNDVAALYARDPSEHGGRPC